MTKTFFLLLAFAASSVSAADRTVKIKDLLKDVPVEDRAAFAGGIMLGGGQVLSANFKPLKSLSDERQTAVKEAFVAKSAPKTKPGKRAPAARLSELLKGVPKPAADAFLDSLVFSGGRVVGASIGTLKKSVTLERYKEMLDALAEPGSKAPAGMKGLCGNGWCEDSLCVARGPERLHCESSPKEICWSTCR